LLADVRRVGRVWVFVHGNRTTAWDAQVAGNELFGLLNQGAGSKECVYLVWSWPSDRICGSNRQDVLLKAYRSEIEGIYLAQWLANLGRDCSIGMVGFSYGCRTILIALHLLAGGKFGPSELTPSPSDLPQEIRIVLIAAASDQEALSPMGATDQALSTVAAAVITANFRDRALRLYPLMYGLRGPRALGLLGPAYLSTEDAEKTAVLPLECWVGTRHTWDAYFSALPLQEHLIRQAQRLGELQATQNPVNLSKRQSADNRHPSPGPMLLDSATIDATSLR